LNDALNAAISMSLKLKEEMNHFLLLDVLINDDDFGLNIESGTFGKNITKEVIGSLTLSFLSRQDTMKKSL
jgi:hypothetical protein